MLTPQQVQEARQKFGIGAPSPVTDAVSRLQSTEQKPQSKGFFSRIVDDAKTRIGNVRQQFGQSTNPISDTLSVAGQAAGFVNDVTGEALSSVASATGIDEPIKKFGLDILDTPGGKLGLQALRAGMDTWEHFKELNPEAANNIANVINIASVLPQGAAAKAGAPLAVKAGDAALDAGKSAVGMIRPKVNPAKAVQQIVQGKTDDAVRSVEALSAIDRTGVDTYGKLYKRLDEAGKKQLAVVDAALAKDKGTTFLDKLATVQKTASGKTIKTNYVDKALNHLREANRNIGDDLAASEIDELITKANTRGLTNKEVNDIARMYNEEFGRKAFGKTGEALTSVNAQMYENVRKGVKEVARRGIGGKEAQAADKIYSSIRNTQRLVEKHLDAVSKAEAKLKEMGIIEKGATFIARATDVLTGGTIRGLIRGVMPESGITAKLNIVELEGRLAKNLKALQEATAKGKADDIINAIKRIAPEDAASKASPVASASASKPITKATPKPVAKPVAKTASKADPLIAEARKYKSAEEFVKAHGNYYHGSAKVIKEFKDMGRGGVYLTPSRMEAQRYGGWSGEVTSAFVDIKKPYIDKSNIFIHAPEKFPEKLAKLKAEGYDSIVRYMGDGNKNPQIFVFDPTKIKTESQLTNIWKKANPKR